MGLPDVDRQFAVSLAVGLLLSAQFGAFFHVPLLYYDARPAYVADEGLAETDYRAVNTTDGNASFEPIPLVEIQARTWVSLYATGIGGAPSADAGDGPPSDGDAPPTDDGPPTTDVENSSVVAVVSMSALKLGPISANPLVYASDPRVLGASGLLIEEIEPHLPENVSEVTDLSIRNERSVTMLDQETTLTTFSGTLVLSDESTVDVRLYLARVVKDGELVVVFGIAPASADGTEEQFATVAENVRLVEWGEGPPESRTGSVVPAHS
jgi:hypothetical protein